MENKGGVESWCVACHGSPRGCGKLGFLHILMLLTIWHRGPSCPRESPPAPLRTAVCPLFWLMEPGAGPLQLLRHTGDSSGCWRPFPLPQPPSQGHGYPSERCRLFFQLLPCSCLFNRCILLGVGQRDFLFHEGSPLFHIPKSRFHCGPQSICPEGGGRGRERRKASEALAWGPLLTLSSPTGMTEVHKGLVLLRQDQLQGRGLP